MAVTTGLLFILIGIFHGVEAFCDGRQDGAQCSGTWGGTVFVQLMDTTTEAIRFDWIKAATKILQWRNNEIVKNTFKERSDFFANNGTLRINNLRGSDGGEYKLELFDSKGKATGNRTLTLSVIGQTPLRVGVISALVFFFIYLFVCVIIIICVQRKKQQCKEAELHADLTYADVRVVKQQGRKKVKRNVEEEVEYSQIKTTAKLNRRDETLEIT